MIRLRNDDFDDPIELERIAKVANLTPPEFAKRFRYVVESEAPPLHFNYP